MLQLSYVSFRQGTYILVEGKEDTERFLIIQSGHVKVHFQNERPGTPPQILGPGDFVGVISCMSQHSQIETVVAMSDVVCISVLRQQYPELIEKNTPVAMKIIRTFAHRMRVLNETLMVQTLKESAEDQTNQIFDIAVYYDKLKEYSIASFAYYQYIKLYKSTPNAKIAMQRFVALKPVSKAVYLESNQDLLRIYPKGTMIMSESQGGADMFIIQDGQVKISKIVNGTEITLAMLKKGDMFGEMALLENKPRSASAIATEECRLMTVNKSNFNQMVATQPQLVARLTTMLAERLWSMHRQLANSMLSSNPVAKMTDMLALQVEKTRIEFKKGTEYQTSLTADDIAAMCGFTKEEKARWLYEFLTNTKHLLKVINGKIYIPDCLELIKQADFYRKQAVKALSGKHDK